MTDSSDSPPDDAAPEGSVKQFAREHPVAASALIISVVAGAGLGFRIFAGTLSPIRSVLGGALAGFGCWLIIMVGRVIGD